MAPGQPEADLADAVMASCAIPGWYQPVRIGGRRYIDGGAWSATSVDLMVGLELTEVFVVAPMVSFAMDEPAQLTTKLERRWRGRVTRRCLHEVALLHGGGTDVTVIGPGPQDLEAIGGNLMDVGRREAVLRTSLETTPAALRDAALLDDGLDLLEGTPRGPGRSRRPDAPDETDGPRLDAMDDPDQPRPADARLRPEHPAGTGDGREAGRPRDGRHAGPRGHARPARVVRRERRGGAGARRVPRRRADRRCGGWPPTPVPYGAAWSSSADVAGPTPVAAVGPDAGDDERSVVVLSSVVVRCRPWPASTSTSRRPSPT